MRLLFFLTVAFLLSNCSNAAKPEADPNQDPNYNEVAPEEEVSIKQDSGVEYERTTSSQDFITEDNVAKDIYYQASLGPFFTVSAYVPYKVKVEFEEQIYKVRNNLSADRKLQILMIAYYPTNSKKEKKFAQQRVNNLISYASWKEKVNKKHFIVKLVPTTEQEKYYTIGFELSVPKGGAEKVTTKRTVYYTGQRKKTKMPVSTKEEVSKDKEETATIEDSANDLVQDTDLPVEDAQ